MNRLSFALTVAIGLASFDAFALSCVRPSEKELVDDYKHIFVVFFTSAIFVPESDDTPRKGKIIANFEVLSVIQGDPDRVPHAEAVISGPTETWPATIPIGQKYILVANDGPAHWGACSHIFRVPPDHFENCQEYSLRRFAGADIPENRSCESEYLWQEFRKLNIEPASSRVDLDGLRAEWAERFGSIP